jgi:hypothetical protein
VISRYRKLGSPSLFWQFQAADLLHGSNFRQLAFLVAAMAAAYSPGFLDLEVFQLRSRNLTQARSLPSIRSALAEFFQVALAFAQLKIHTICEH